MNAAVLQAAEGVEEDVLEAIAEEPRLIEVPETGIVKMHFHKMSDVMCQKGCILQSLYYQLQSSSKVI